MHAQIHAYNNTCTQYTHSYLLWMYCIVLNTRTHIVYCTFISCIVFNTRIHIVLWMYCIIFNTRIHIVHRIQYTRIHISIHAFTHGIHICRTRMTRKWKLEGNIVNLAPFYSIVECCAWKRNSYSKCKYTHLQRLCLMQLWRCIYTSVHLYTHTHTHTHTYIYIYLFILALGWGRRYIHIHTYKV
jgi:hypothetical protein